MPTYTYTCSKCNKVHDETYTSYVDRKKVIKCECGGKAYYDFAETFSGARIAQDGDREYISEGMAVNPDQVVQTIEEDKHMGSSAEKYLPDGRLVFKSWKQKQDYMVLRGFNE